MRERERERERLSNFKERLSWKQIKPSLNKDNCLWKKITRALTLF